MSLMGAIRSALLAGAAAGSAHGARAQDEQPGPDALDRALETVSADDLRNRLEIVASDAMEGRMAGHRGSERVAEYLISHCVRLGLEAAGDDGYRQRFTIRRRDGDLETANLVARLPGRDAQHGEEYVLLTAHYDHVGTEGDPDVGRLGGAKEGDSIWNGADDNASGSVGVLEVAEAFARSGLVPRRSLLFVWFSGEEHGLLGAYHFVRATSIPLEKIVAVVNMDMIGRNADRPVEIDATGSLEGDLWGRWIRCAQEIAAPDLELKLSSYSPPNSDHHAFIQNRVPAILIFSGLHRDYHRVSDHADQIEYPRMAQICRLVTALLKIAGDSDEKLVFAEPAVSTRNINELGVNLDGALSAREMRSLGYPDQGGYLVRTIVSKSPAERAGIQLGDILLRVRGTRLDADDPATSLRRLVLGAGRGKDIPIALLRSGAEVEVTALFPKPGPKETPDEG